MQHKMPVPPTAQMPEVRENLGAFSLQAAVRYPYNECRSNRLCGGSGVSCGNLAGVS